MADIESQSRILALPASPILLNQSRTEAQHFSLEHEIDLVELIDYGQAIGTDLLAGAEVTMLHLGFDVLLVEGVITAPAC